MSLPRRTLLKALGLTAASSFLPGRARVHAEAPPTRIVFFIQPHGHVPKAWNMAIPDAPLDKFAERPLRDLAESELSKVLQPLHPFRDRVLAVEGLSHMSVLSDLAQLTPGQDPNNHSLAVAGLLTCSRALQRPDVPCTGGGRSLDQELARLTGAPGRFGSRVYGLDYVPNATVAPFSFLGAGMPTPVVHDPALGLSDLLGLGGPVISAPTSRQALIDALRGSVLDGVAAEYEAVLPRLPASERAKLGAHRDLVRDLERSVSTGIKAHCELSLEPQIEQVPSILRLIRLALACDLTRVVTFVAPVPECPEFGYPAEANVHATYAHASVEGATSCGQVYTPKAERAMTDLGVWYAKLFARLLGDLDAVAEGNGTLLDHTLVVWLTELGTPTHQHHDTFSLIAGSANFFKLGRYVRYPRALQNPVKKEPLLGPAQSRLFVSLLQAMGQRVESFGMARAQGAAGAELSLSGALTELQR
jgi:hypothetical protein